MILGWFRKPRQIEHDFCQNSLSAYLDGVVSTRDRARLERHLAECTDCRQTLSQLRATVALLHQTPALPVPRSFALPLSVGVRQTERRAFRLNPGYFALAASVATAVLVLVVSGDLLLRSGFLGTNQSPASAPEAYGRGAEPALEGTHLESVTAPAADGTALMLAAPAPVADMTTGPGTQMATDNSLASATSEAEAALGSQTLSPQALPSLTFARPAGAPPPPASTPGGTTVPSPAAMDKSVVPTVVPTEEPTATPTPTVTPTPEPTATPAAVGMTSLSGQVVPVSLREKRPEPPSTAAPLADDSSTRRETILTLFRWLEMAIGGLAAVMLFLSLWLRLARQPA